MNFKQDQHKNVLLINAHQLYPGKSPESPGRLNKTLVGVLKAEMEKHGYEVRETYIEHGYNIDEEVEKHLWADIIILQSPVFWFATPWIYKKYADELFNVGLMQQSFLESDGRTREDPHKQYGTGGKMQGKKYMLSLTWNAPKEAFSDKNQYLFAGKTVDDAFISNTTNYKFCGVEILPSFSCYDVMKNPDVEGNIARLRQHLSRYIDSKSAKQIQH